MCPRSICAHGSCNGGSDAERHATRAYVVWFVYDRYRNTCWRWWRVVLLCSRPIRQHYATHARVCVLPPRVFRVPGAFCGGDLCVSLSSFSAKCPQPRNRYIDLSVVQSAEESWLAVWLALECPETGSLRIDEICTRSHLAGLKRFHREMG